jgi:prophage regulatory protein
MACHLPGMPDDVACDATVPQQILSRIDVRRATSLSLSAIDRLEAAGAFPVRVSLSPGRVGYLATEVMEWIKARAQARSTAQMTPGQRSLVTNGFILGPGADTS